MSALVPSSPALPHMYTFMLDHRIPKSNVGRIQMRTTSSDCGVNIAILHESEGPVVLVCIDFWGYV